MVGLCEQLFHRGLSDREQRDRELKLLLSSQDEVEERYKNQTTLVLEDFNKQHREARGHKLLCKVTKMYCL